MNDEFEKLKFLKETGVLSQEEFDQLAMRIDSSYQPNIDDRKSRGIYLILAFLLGIFGVHNFYISRFKRGFIQLILTLILTQFFGLGLLVFIWALVDMFVVKTDETGKEMAPSGCVAYILVGLVIVVILLIVLIGGIAGYKMAMDRYTANEVLDGVKKYSVLSYETCKKMESSGQIFSIDECKGGLIPAYTEMGLGKLPISAKSIEFERFSTLTNFNKKVSIIKVQLENKAVCQAFVKLFNNPNLVTTCSDDLKVQAIVPAER